MTMKTVLMMFSTYFLLSGAGLSGATIQWGGVVSSTFFLSDGTQVTSGETPDIGLTFELGTFESGFIPEGDNLGDWRSNWKSLDTADFSLQNQFFSGSFIFEDEDSSLGDIQFNGSNFEVGEDVFIWAYNQEAVDSNLEWSLVTGNAGLDTAGAPPSNENWELPDPGQSNQGTFPLNWRTSTADTAVFGSVGDSTGDGVISDPQSGDFQFATVPEPSTGLYVLLTGLLVLKLRKRS